MSVAARLRGAFAVYIALLAAVVLYHSRTIQRTVGSGQALTEISARLRVSSTDELTHIAQMSGDAEKYLITRDPGYLAKFQEFSTEFARGIHHLDSIPLSTGERAALVPLSRDWRRLEARARGLSDVTRLPEGAGRDSLAGLQETLDQVRLDTQQLSAASQDAMDEELRSSEADARAAERVSWVAAGGALLLSIVLSAVLVRSIVGPLSRLATGTHEVAAGRFGYRLDARGGDEFAQVARDFNSMTERLDELDRMKRDFVAKVSHDLKTPLSSMQETIAAILDEVAGPVTPKQRRLLELNLDSGRRLSAMLSKLLDLSRIEAGLEPDFQMLDVVQVVKRSLERVDAVRNDRGFRVTLAEPDRRLLVRGDADGVSQVLDNLLENAAKFSPTDGTVSVRVAQWSAGGNRVPPEHAAAIGGRGLLGGAVLITVSDEGPGVPDDEKERIFTRFYQTEAGRAARGRGGVGLGLTICREIVAAHGGSIWVADNEPCGSVFCVVLPGAVAAPELPGGTALAASGRSVS